MTDQHDEMDMAVSGAADVAAEAAILPEGSEAPLDPVLAGVRATQAAASTQTELQNLAVIMGVPVKMQVVLGAAVMPVANLLKLGCGAVVELDRKVGEPVAITINERVIARGEVVVVDDDRFGVTLTDIVSEPIPGMAAGF
jgi:flagellar motor switch protein FliN/FliY